MKPKTFISYSRQCIGFVDDLFYRLEKQGFNNIWLDYLSLVPGRPWNGQIDKGLKEAELLLLVVSPESISSRSVEIEWRHFLENKKRIILLIFQAVPLPKELSQLEWVDFRGGFASALRNLTKLIESPTSIKKLAPQSGFKAPFTVWLAAGLSVITAIYSLFAFWTILIPWVLIPLTYRIFKRDFKILQIQLALWILPIALFFTLGLGIELGMVNADANFDYNNLFSLYNAVLLFLFLQIYLIPLISLFLWLLLRSPIMQRWGMPESSLPRFKNIYYPNSSQPTPVHYFIDYAPQDSKVARELDLVLKKYGHTPADEISSANEVLVILSRFKTDTQADPEKQVVYPILLQRTKISEKLSRMQWIDFRKGIRNLDAIAQLLPEPEKLLKALGVRPTGSRQAAMPNIVLVLIDYLLIMALMNVGSFLSYILELIYLDIGDMFKIEPLKIFNIMSLLFVLVLFSVILIYFIVQSLTERRGFFASPIFLSLGMFGVLALFTWQAILGDDMDILFRIYGVIPETLFAFLPFILFILGGFFVGIALLFRWRVLNRWLPAV